MIFFKIQMLASNLTQKFDENEGIMGFLEDDLTKESKRASRLVSEVRFPSINKTLNIFIFFFSIGLFLL